MSNPDVLASTPDAAPIFAALGDRTRLSLIRKLSGGESQSIARLSEDSDLTRQAVTKHLRVLEDAGLVVVNRIGRESLYECRPKALEAARTYLDEVTSQWSDALGRLKLFVEIDP
jgi:DNA-binding transcriptional ArsR family regulator